MKYRGSFIIPDINITYCLRLLSILIKVEVKIKPAAKSKKILHLLILKKP